MPRFAMLKLAIIRRSKGCEPFTQDGCTTLVSKKAQRYY